MKSAFCFAVASLLLLASARADDATERAQAALKEQGFYYGEVNGQTNSDTVAAIRRFQIRNGLQVTGELNNETVTALRSHRTNQVRTSPPSNAAPEIATTPAITRSLPAPVEPPENPTPPPPANAPVDVFAATPFEAAPPELQRRVIVGAQTILRRRGFYRGPVNGVYDPALSFSLRAFQSNARLAPTGHFEMETLSALGLLPGQQIAPVRRVYPRQPLAEPPVRGEWIPERGHRRDRDDDDND